MDAGEDVGEAPAAERPAPLLEVLPQERVRRRTVEQIVDPVLVVPMLFMVEPQMVEQLVDILSPLICRVAEQVVEVPKIVCPPRGARTALRAPQTVVQLVEVPTPVSHSSTITANCGYIPVPGHEGRFSGIEVFFPDRIQQPAVAQIVPNPTSGGGLQGFLPRQSSTAGCCADR